jgi:polar amino acid transport system substrate-binding protein
MTITRIAAAACVTALLCVPALAQQPAKQAVDQALRDKLPKEIRDAGEMVSVNNGSFPPYEIIGDNHTMTGASAELTDALGEVLGIKIRHETVSGLAAVLAGIKSGRYQMASGPIGDFPDRELQNDFVDFVQEFVVFAVQKGNPKGFKSVADTCGARISVMAAGSAEKVIKQQAEECVKAGKPAVEVQSFTDQPTAILAVRSKRADGFFSSQAPLTYFVQQTNGQLELAATGAKNGFEDLYQGSVVPKGSVLGGVVLAAYQKLFDNGTYAAIMKKWGLEGNMIKAPGMNLAGKKTQ